MAVSLGGEQMTVSMTVDPAQDHVMGVYGECTVKHQENVRESRLIKMTNTDRASF